MDEDSEDPALAVKRFPSRQERPDLYILADEWIRTQVLFVEKSRQMMVTWLFVLLYLHRTCFFQGRRTFFQSKKEEDAKNLKKRASFTFLRLPKFLQPVYEIKETKIEFPNLESEIWAIPQGGDHVRSYTVSGLLSDEAAFQPEFPDAYSAALPAIGGHGKFTAVSSANGKNSWWRIVRDIQRTKR